MKKQTDQNKPRKEPNKPNIYQNSPTQDDTSKDRKDYKEQETKNTSNAPAKDNKSQTGRADLYDAIIGSATDNVHSRRHHDTLGNTGTNISYEGPTAPGSGGSVGTGNASGQSAVGGTISTDSDYEMGRVAHQPKKDEENDEEENERDIS